MTATALWIAALAVKATVVLLATWVVAALLRSRSPALRHLVWSAGLIAVLALPLLSLSLPWRVEITTPLPAPTVVQATATAAPVTRPDVPVTATAPTVVTTRDVPTGAPAWRPDLATVLFALWATGVALALLRLAVGVLLVRRILRAATPLVAPAWTHPLIESADRLELSRLPRLVASARTPMPFTGGLVRPFVVVPSDADAWDDRRRRAVLSHELAHIRRRDLILNTLAQVACAFWWFHPLVWVAARRARMESERACDNLVLGIGTRASEYADHLLQIVCGAARSRTPALALPMAERREFEGRVLAILDTGGARHAPTRRLMAGFAAGAALLVLPIAVLAPAARRADPVLQAPPIAAGIPTAADAATTVNGRTSAEVQTAAIESRTETPPAGIQDTSRLVTALIRALGDSVAEVRDNAAYALGRRRVAEAMQPLGLLVTGDPSADVRQTAVWAIMQIGTHAGSAAIFQAALRDASPDVREIAAWALGQTGQRGATSALEPLLADGTADVRHTAAWAIGTLRPDAAPAALLTAIGDPSPDVAEAAAWAAGQIGDPRAMPSLITAIDSPSSDVREAAMWALGRMEGDAAQDALLRATESPNPDVRRAAVGALAGVNSRPWPWPWPRPMIR